MKVKVKVRVKEPEKVEITTEYIKLDSFLKFMAIAETGGEGKQIIQDGEVRVNGEVCTVRGKKLRDGDIVSVFSRSYKITGA